jgi:hypothetical protein
MMDRDADRVRVDLREMSDIMERVRSKKKKKPKVEKPVV